MVVSRGVWSLRRAGSFPEGSPSPFLKSPNLRFGHFDRDHHPGKKSFS
jgi:hypothetical protein